MIKKINIKTPLFSVILLLLSLCLKAQEYITPLSANNTLINSNQIKQPLASKTSSVVLTDSLPFFDDFSYSTTSPYPTIDHWLDSSVFINHTFPIAPPSIGVATFDGLNKKGYPYNISALPTNSSPADRLTSKKINLYNKGGFFYTPADSIYLSFYYQAQGRGDNPEANDSLSIDFFKPNQNKWVRMKSFKGYIPPASDTLFHLVMIPIKDTAYLDSAFQFRFRNNATLSGSLDHWHIDYVYLDKNRSIIDTVKEDVAFEYMSTSYLKNYYSMPYNHFLPSEMATTLHNYTRNNYTASKYSSYTDTIYDKNHVKIHSYDGGPATVNPYSQIGTNNVTSHATPTNTFVFASPLTDTAVFTIKHYIYTNPDLVRPNDSIIQIQKLSNYFAYDDGTAEGGYNNGSTVYGVKNALRYTLNVDDTLRAMRIYFDPVRDGQNIINTTFRMFIWTDGGNGPGTVIYKDSADKPIYIQGSHNLMPTYYLTSCKFLPANTYYFGLQQGTNRALNIGFDKNNDHSNALYYDIGNGWVQSDTKGSLMINPVFGCTVPPLPVGIKETTQLESAELNLYPNPAQNSITITLNNLIIENATVTILSAIGQTVLTETYNAQQPIDISNLTDGIYFVYLNSSTLNVIPKKLIIAR